MNKLNGADEAMFLILRDRLDLPTAMLKQDKKIKFTASKSKVAVV